MLVNLCAHLDGNCQQRNEFGEGATRDLDSRFPRSKQHCHELDPMYRTILYRSRGHLNFRGIEFVFGLRTRSIPVNPVNGAADTPMRTHYKV